MREKYRGSNWLLGLQLDRICSKQNSRTQQCVTEIALYLLRMMAYLTPWFKTKSNISPFKNNKFQVIYQAYTPEN